MTKFSKDIIAAKAGIQSKQEAIRERLMRSYQEWKAAFNAMPSLVAKGSRGSRYSKSVSRRSVSNATTPVPKVPKTPTDDPLGLDMQDYEQNIINSIVASSTYQNLVISIRKHTSINQFRNNLRNSVAVVSSKSQRLRLLLQYLHTICGHFDNPKTNPSEQKLQQDFARGAKLVNNVLSGNIIDGIDVYESGGASAAGMAYLHTPGENEGNQGAHVPTQ